MRDWATVAWLAFLIAAVLMGGWFMILHGQLKGLLGRKEWTAEEREQVVWFLFYGASSLAFMAGAVVLSFA